MESIYNRVKRAKGWQFERVEEGQGKRTAHLKPPFYARPWKDGKQHWHRLLADTFEKAKEEADKLDAALKAAALGLTVAEAENIGSKIPLAVAVRRFMADNASKAPKTVAQYRHALKQFSESARVNYLDEVTVNVLKRFKADLEADGYAGKTIDTRINIVYFMLKDNGIAARIPTKYMPTIEEEPAVAYSEDELTKLFAAMDDEARIRYRFFLGSACRDREVTFAAWTDIDFKANTYVVRKKDDVGFFPKSHESRTIELPANLVRELKARREAHPDDRWLFLSAQGNPDNHFLRKLKKIALRAGLNCGQCETTITVGEYNGRKKVKVRCDKYPVCEHYILHRFRKTCATRWLESGATLRDIQLLLGHKSLATTQKYLGATVSAKLRPIIDRAFGD
jgi:integrase/recombinase XerD